jgi:glycosyltransferase involved in cell wall biosynthesis
MIVGDGRAEELDACLASFRPHVDQAVIVYTGDKKNRSVQKVAHKHGCEYFTFTWTHNFAEARNFALSKMRTDWITWADSDDTLENPEHLRELITRLPEDIGGVWFPYIYARDEYGNPNTIHDKERLLRASEGWRWEGRLHEVLVPSRAVHWERDTETLWLHNSQGDHRSDRNLPILLKWVQDEPENIRIFLFLGNQYFAKGDYPEAAKWYTKFYTYNKDGLVGTPHDRYAAMTYAARALREFRQNQSALQADMAAVELFPNWADAYIGIAETYMRAGKHAKAIEWGETALTKGPADRVVITNPLDYTWRIWNILNVSFANEGRLDDAIAACENALQARPHDEQIIHNLNVYRDLKPRYELANTLHTMKPEDALAVAEVLPEETRRIATARDVWVPALLSKTYRGTQPRVGIFCGGSMEEWDGTTPSTRGIGGSETAVVEVAKRLAQAGQEVIVYNRAGYGEGRHDGVLYTNWERFRPSAYHDTFVSWRQPGIVNENPNASQRMLWLHDLNMGDAITEDVARGYDRVMGVSEWHADYLTKCYPFLDAAKVGVLPNGINLERFNQPHGERAVHRLVYTSSPDRGLANLLRMWPEIRRVCGPEAELHIFYGWENFIQAIRMGHSHYRDIMEGIKFLGRQPGVVWRGRLGQDDLARELLEADAWLYPTSFLETCCIAAAEAQAAGLKIVTSACGNLPNMVGDAGLCVPGQATSQAYQQSFLKVSWGMLTDLKTRIDYAARGPEHIKDFTWDNAAKVWLDELANVERKVVAK